MLRRTTLTFTAALAAVSLLPSGAFAEMLASVDKPVTISFYNYNLASASAGAEATKELIADFEKKFPNIKVETVAVPSNEIMSRVQADIVAGKQPDVAQLVFRDLIYIASDLGANALEDMVDAKELKDQLTGMIPQGLELGKVDGKTYGLAYTFSTPILFYNGDLFKQADLDPDKPPRTWDDVAAAGKAIKEKTGKNGFFPGAYGPTDGTFVYQSIVMSNGGKVRDGNKLTFADRDAADAVNVCRRQHGHVPLYERAAFQRQEIGPGQVRPAPCSDAFLWRQADGADQFRQRPLRLQQGPRQAARLL